jgi:1-acyl-sn-glycerol-3-phosphate acyltransferase
MSNHASLYDSPLILAALPLSVRMITKKELFKVPVWGHALRAAEFVSMNRENKTEAMQALQIAREKMQSGIVPWISPEGTRSRTGEIQPFKKGGFLIAIKTGALIVPVKISGAYAVLPPKSLDFQVDKEVDLHISTPIDAAKYSIQDIGKLMDLVKSKLT